MEKGKGQTILNKKKVLIPSSLSTAYQRGAEIIDNRCDPGTKTKSPRSTRAMKTREPSRIGLPRRGHAIRFWRATAPHQRGTVEGKDEGKGNLERRHEPGRRRRARRAWRAAGRGPSSPCAGGRSPGTCAMAISSCSSPTSNPRAGTAGSDQQATPGPGGEAGERRGRRGWVPSSLLLSSFGILGTKNGGERIVSRRRRRGAIAGGTGLYGVCFFYPKEERRWVGSFWSSLTKQKK